MRKWMERADFVVTLVAVAGAIACGGYATAAMFVDWPLSSGVVWAGSAAGFFAFAHVVIGDAQERHKRKIRRLAVEAE